MFYRENRAKIANFPHIRNISAPNFSSLRSFPSSFFGSLPQSTMVHLIFCLAISHKVRNFAPQKRYCF